MRGLTHTAPPKYTPGKTFVTAIKLWNDDRDRDGIRPENIIVRLLANGEEIDRASISAASGWFTIWSGLDMNADGKPIEYTVTEDPVAGYTAEITGDGKAGFTVTNTHTVETVDITVNKVWEDDNNKSGNRPNNITAHLLVNGVKVDTHTITADEGWKTTFTELPKYSGGKEVTYVVAEDAVENYITTVQGYTITNKLRETVNPSKSGGSSTPTAKAATAAKTGDTNNLMAMVLMLIAALATLVVLIRRRRYIG